ncbi:MAG TPA: hypothetical protein EYN54_13915 [Methylococcaceae bacterium]|nr:hypothetical protein [Methylococcaceae bacterium]
MKFTLDEEQTVPRGTYSYIADVGAGSITLSYAPAGEMKLLNTADITDGVITGSPTDLIQVSTCRFKAGLTGDATFSMTRA